MLRGAQYTAPCGISSLPKSRAFLFISEFFARRNISEGRKCPSCSRSHEVIGIRRALPAPNQLFCQMLCMDHQAAILVSPFCSPSLKLTPSTTFGNKACPFGVHHSCSAVFVNLKAIANTLPRDTQHLTITRMTHLTFCRSHWDPAGDTWRWHPDPTGSHGGDHWDIGGPKGPNREKGKQEWWPNRPGGIRELKPPGSKRLVECPGIGLKNPITFPNIPPPTPQQTIAIGIAGTAIIIIAAVVLLPIGL